MKQIRNMTQVELAAYIQDALQAKGIRVVLSGGSAVSFYSSNKYVSKDLDLINANFAKRSGIKSVMGHWALTNGEDISSIPNQIILLSFPMVRFRLGRSLYKRSINSIFQLERCM